MNLSEKGMLIDKAINQFHLNENIPIMTDEILDIYNKYISDLDNDNVYAVQQSFKFTIDGFLYIGKADQIRHSPRGLAVWDIKLSYKPCLRLINRYIETLMIYAYGLNVRIGGLINVRNYLNNKPVFHVIDAPSPKLSEMRILNNLIYNANNKGEKNDKRIKRY